MIIRLNAEKDSPLRKGDLLENALEPARFVRKHL
jgi:hypothetical protein